jgi:hypothetical protein
VTNDSAHHNKLERNPSIEPNPPLNIHHYLLAYPDLSLRDEVMGDYEDAPTAHPRQRKGKSGTEIGSECSGPLHSATLPDAPLECAGILSRRSVLPAAIVSYRPTLGK